MKSALAVVLTAAMASCPSVYAFVAPPPLSASSPRVYTDSDRLHLRPKYKLSPTASAASPPRDDDAFERKSPQSSSRRRRASSRRMSSRSADAAAAPSLSLPKIRLYNSLTRQKEPLVPMNPPRVTMYTCGPTVYDSAHVGNFRAFLTYDVLKRALSYLGYDVDHVCNLTDVDDKIIKRCDREGLSLTELTRRYESAFFDDLDALNIVRAREYPRATDHIDEMAQLIKDLEAKNLAYQSDEGSWYFNVGAKEGYGTRLVDLQPAEMQSGAARGGAQRGTDADEYDADKVGVRDFAIWKAFKPGFDRDDAAWNPEGYGIGRGRPGWHLECSAMARKYLGDTIDLHAGGIDLKFPHHENEIAQSEGANGVPFCNCWIHNGFVNIGDEKMSKSKGNFLTLRRACPGPDDVRAYRYLIVSSQYRNPLSFTEAALGAAKGALKRLDRARDRIDGALADAGLSLEESDGSGNEALSSGGVENSIVAKVKKELANFETAIADDLSMPRASACLFSIVKATEAEFKRADKAQKNEAEGPPSPPLDLAGLARLRVALHKMDMVFGIYYEVPAPEGGAYSANRNDSAAESADAGDVVPDEVMKLVLQRSAAKDGKDWELADSLRANITELGFAVKDIKGGDPIVSRA